LKRVARVGAEASAAKVQGDFTASSGKVLSSRGGYDWPAGRSGGTGRRAGLKIRFPLGSVGSIPTFGT
jgi:hypothetical protein